MKKLLGVMLLLAVSLGIRAQSVPCNNSFVKQVDGIGTIEPRIFRDPAAPNYFLTARSNDTTFISGTDAAGVVLWTKAIKFLGDNGTIVDMIVDQFDGTLVGVVRGVNSNFMFRYNYSTATFNWIKRYPSNYLFQNVHQTGTNSYVVTGQVLGGAITIFNVDRNTGNMTIFQRSGFTGEFFSAYDAASAGIYGACRYYTTGSLFNPALYRFNPASGINLWTTTYIQNTAGSTARIYPVAPVVDGGQLVQLSSGDPTPNFGTYQSGPTNVWLLKTDLGGNLMWTNQINIPGYNQLNVKKIINTATGYYLLIDSYNGTMINYFFVVKTNKGGRVQWANRYGISGENTVIAGVEDNGYLYLTASSQSYSTASPFLFLKLDPLGMTDATCPFIRKVNAFETPYTNTQAPKPVNTAVTAYNNNPASIAQNNITSRERVHCAINCPPPCSTLSGTLSTGVLAFYPFGYGSLSDLSGNGNHLQNPTTAVPTLDRGGSQNCAYRFNGADFLTPIGSSNFLNNITTSPFSISLWYQPLGTRPVGAYELLVGRGNPPLHCPDTWGEWSLGLYDCRKAVMGFDFYSHWEQTTMTCANFMSFISNGWHHLAFVYDGTNYLMYRDGILSSTSSGPCGPGTANIGAMMLGVDYNGDLDDIVIYNRALSVAEVNTLMNLNGSCCDGLTSTIGKVLTLPQQPYAVKVYPNPTDGKVTVSAAPTTIRSIGLYNNTGQVLNTYLFNTKEATLSLDHLAAGVYFLKITTDLGTTTEKVIRR